jgi:hypothetical protein
MDGSQQLPPVWRAYAKAAYDLGFRLAESALKPGRSSGRVFF